MSKPRAGYRRKADAPRRTVGSAVQRRASQHRRRRDQRKVHHDGMAGWILSAAGRQSDHHERRRDEELRHARMRCSPVPLSAKAISSSAKWTKATAPSRGYTPHIAVVNNVDWITNRWKNCAACFAIFVAKADIAVLNLDNEETAALAADKPIITA